MRNTTSWSLSVVVLCLLATSVSAKNTIGFRAGTGFTGDDLLIALGADLNLSVHPAFGFRFGALHAPKLTTGTFGVGVGGNRAVHNTAGLRRYYLELSALAKAGKYVTALFGPYFAVATSCTVEYFFGEVVTESSCDQAGTRATGGVDFGLKGGLGLEVPITDRLQAEFTALLGISVSEVTLTRPGNLVTLENETPRMGGLAFVAGITVPIE